MPVYSSDHHALHSLHEQTQKRVEELEAENSELREKIHNIIQYRSKERRRILWNKATSIFAGLFRSKYLSKLYSIDFAILCILLAMASLLAYLFWDAHVNRSEMRDIIEDYYKEEYDEEPVYRDCGDISGSKVRCSLYFENSGRESIICIRSEKSCFSV